MRTKTIIKGSIVRINLKWLDGGREDDITAVTSHPVNLSELASAIESSDCGGDETWGRFVDVLCRVRMSDVVTNSSTRFVAVGGSELDWGPPDGKWVLEIQELPAVAAGNFALDLPLGESLVNTEEIVGHSPKARLVRKKSL